MIEYRKSCSIGDLTSNMNNNQLTTLPEEIGLFFSLTNLDVSMNELTSLPASIGQIASLRLLDVSMNDDLTDLPDGITQSISLRVIR